MLKKKKQTVLSRCKVQRQEFQNAKYSDKPIFTKSAIAKLLQTIKNDALI